MINPDDQTVSHYLDQLEEYMAGRKDHTDSRDLLEDYKGVETVQRYFSLISEQYGEGGPILKDKESIVNDLSEASTFKQVEEDVVSKVLQMLDSFEPHDPEYEEINSGNIQQVGDEKYFIKINNPEVFERALDQFEPLSSSGEDFTHTDEGSIYENRSFYDKL